MKPVARQTRPATGAVALVVPALAMAAGLGVLLMSSRVALSTLAVALAGVTLLAAGPVYARPLALIDFFTLTLLALSLTVSTGLAVTPAT